MTMTTYNLIKRNKKIRNIKKAARIKYELGRRGFKLNNIAQELKMSNAAVFRSINDLSKISRVDEWIKINLGFEFIDGDIN